MVPVRAIVAVVLSAIICNAVESIQKNALALWEPTGGGLAFWRKKFSRAFNGARALHRSEFYRAKLKSDLVRLATDTIVGELTGKAETHPHKQRSTRNREGDTGNSRKVSREGGKCLTDLVYHISFLSKP